MQDTFSLLSSFLSPFRDQLAAEIVTCPVNTSSLSIRPILRRCYLFRGRNETATRPSVEQKPLPSFSSVRPTLLQRSEFGGTARSGNGIYPSPEI